MTDAATPAPEKTVLIGCDSCNRRTHHKPLGKAGQSSDDGYGIWEHRDYLIVECQGCKTISFCIEITNSEDVDCDPTTGEYFRVKSYEQYPSRLVGRPTLDMLHELPSGIRSVYRETRNALCSQQPILAGIGMRAIVEAVCNEQKIAGPNLNNRIDALASNGIVTKDGADIIHSIRLMGNKAAHEVQPNTIEELNTAFTVVEYLLKGVYIMPKLAAKLPKQGP